MLLAAVIQLIILLALTSAQPDIGSWFAETLSMVLGIGALISFGGFLFSFFQSIVKPNNVNIINGSCVNGHGECFLLINKDEEDKKEKEIYIGNFKEKMRDGKGRYDFSNGDFYDGEWKNDMMNGKGIYKWKSGDYYEGGFENGYQNGSGKLFHTSGEVQDGIWGGIIAPKKIRNCSANEE